MTALGFAAYGAAASAIDQHLPTMITQQLASRMMRDQDPTLWGPDAVDEASKRLGWTQPFEDAYKALDEAEAYAAQLREAGIEHIILAGMGGSSLAPELIAADAGAQTLTVLDSTDPAHISRVLDRDLSRTVMVVASKSGSTTETDSQRRAFLGACEEAGLHGPDHVVVVTDPGSPLAQTATEDGYRKIFYGDPDIGGRFSALSAFGIVPTVLAGIDTRAVVEDAAAIAELISEDDTDNMALQLAAALGGTQPLRDKLIIINHGTDVQPVLPGFGAWAEQLIAESTGKNGYGLLPVPVSPEAYEATHGLDDAIRIHLLGEDDDYSLAEGQDAIALHGPLGAQFFLWEAATSLACTFAPVNPFDQPDVESAKVAARKQLAEEPVPPAPNFAEDTIAMLPSGPFDSASSLQEALKQLTAAVKSTGYLSIQAYLDREADTELEQIRDTLAANIGRPVTFGWGPRFLHSTGQYHKGGPANGVFLQITTTDQPEHDIPGRPFGFGQLIQAQADGDASVLAGHRLPVLRLSLTDRAAGIRQLADLVASLNTV
ncbi:glucose-6-phosphate isomerase [Micrococcoides hystricis]|uniref:Glucose-6-phosphate isomerase n=1 Tax=Micrococcoides hystricis TaxID=1572761 RepID=A0ABV6P8K7_9MICC